MITEALYLFNERQSVRCKPTIDVDDGSFVGCKSMITLAVQNYIKGVYNPIQEHFDETDPDDERVQYIALLEQIVLVLINAHGEKFGENEFGINIASLELYKVAGKSATIEQSENVTKLRL